MDKPIPGKPARGCEGCDGRAFGWKAGTKASNISMLDGGSAQSPLINICIFAPAG